MCFHLTRLIPSIGSMSWSLEGRAWPSGPSRWRRAISASNAHAKYVAIFDQSGPNVSERGSGTFDVTDLSSANDEPVIVAQVEPQAGEFISGFFHAKTMIFQGAITGPLTFGVGGLTTASLSSGDPVGLISFGLLYVPFLYTSGSPVLGSSAYLNASYSSLGMTVGTYVWSWGSGDHADTFTIEVDLPEPSTWALMLLGFAGVGFASRRASKRLASELESLL